MLGIAELSPQTCGCGSNRPSIELQSQQEITSHVYSLRAIFYLPWHRHQVGGTNGLSPETQTMWVELNCARFETAVGWWIRTIDRRSRFLNPTTAPNVIGCDDDDCMVTMIMTTMMTHAIWTTDYKLLLTIVDALIPALGIIMFFNASSVPGNNVNTDGDKFCQRSAQSFVNTSI